MFKGPLPFSKILQKSNNDFLITYNFVHNAEINRIRAKPEMLFYIL